MRGLGNHPHPLNALDPAGYTGTLRIPHHTEEYMQFTAKLVKQLAVVALILTLSLVSAYMGTKAATDHAQPSSPYKMKFWSIDEPPRPCPQC